MYASRRLRAGSILVAFLALALLVPDAALAATHSVHVDITPAHIANSFSPLRALGAEGGCIGRWHSFLPGTIVLLLFNILPS